MISPKFPVFLAALAALAALAGCSAPDGPADPARDAQAPAGDASGADQTAQADPAQDEQISILRPDVEPPEPEPAPTSAPLAPLTLTIAFPEGGRELDAPAVAQLEEVLASEQIALGGPIILRAHSDSAGSDAANLKASEGRGLAVAQWLTERGVAADRITVLAFGEQNPVEPNALPDGSPNEAGRSANRRVEIEIPTLTGATGNAEAPRDDPPSSSAP